MPGLPADVNVQEHLAYLLGLALATYPDPGHSFSTAHGSQLRSSMQARKALLHMYSP